ncbi:hypothetical protein BDZ97DRAFT_2077007 [Flammula alnicola]|nr:hypothetical protein BDZ97DRAFT_2077007 [Flammula alnicola]
MADSSSTTPSAASNDADNTLQPTPFIAKRLSIIVPPANPKPVKAKGKKKSAGRKVTGTLKNFVDLPLDIIYETVSYLEPLDLLTLARLSKEFRALFMSRSSLAIWRRVLNDVPDLPSCPRDLSEPQYASLIFEKFCMACGSTRGAIDVDFKIRMRFCATCAKANIIPGYRLRIRYGDIASTAVTLIPFSAPHYFLCDETDYSTVNNDLRTSYFRPEADLVITELVARTEQKDTTPDEYNTFIADQRVIASRMMNEGNLMKDYTENLLCAQEEVDEQTAIRRFERIQQEMRALGWEEKYFPKWCDEEDFDQWDEYMHQPKEFTTRGWNMIRPKLTAIYNRCKRIRLVEDLIERTGLKYLEFRSEQPLEQRRRLPGWGDVFMLPFVLLFFRDKHVECKEEDMEALMHTIVECTDNFMEMVEEDLRMMITSCDPTQEILETKKEEDKEQGRVSKQRKVKSNAKGKGKSKETHATTATPVLDKAANVFLCNCRECAIGRWGEHTVISYPDVVEHVIVRSCPSKGWEQIKPETSIDLLNAARDVLAALGLPEDCTRDEVHSLGKLVCRCGHYHYEGMLSFDDLVEHVYHQQLGYSNIRKDVAMESDHLIDEFLVNGHSRERLAELVEVATEKDYHEPESDSDSDNSSESVNPRRRSSDIPLGRYCRYCYQLTLDVRAVRNEMAAYHVKYKHGKESQADDFDERVNLANLYGEVDWGSFHFFIP